MKINILSFDVEEWYLGDKTTQRDTIYWSLLESRVEQNTQKILSFLMKRNLKATFFIMGLTAEQHPGLVKKIDAEGHEIGYHSYYHFSPEDQSETDFENDLTHGVSVLQKLTGKKVRFYRAPMFSLCENSSWMIPILIRHGIEVSSSSRSLRFIHHQKIPSSPFLFDVKGKQLLELPLNRCNLPLLKLIYTGSGYFRILPFWLTNMLFRLSEYNMSYFHPRDFDEEVPFSPFLPDYRNMMNRLGNTTTSMKLEKLVKYMKWQTIGETVTRIDKQKIPVVKI